MDIYTIDRKGTISAGYEMAAWDGAEWQPVTLTSGRIFHSGTPSIFELELPKAFLGNPAFVNLSVVSVGRGRVHTAGDIMGTDASPIQWDEPVLLDRFSRIDLVEND